jgi:hypothetical protein
LGRLDLIKWIDLNPCTDSRGTLTAIEGTQTIPFDIKRVYFMHDLTAARAGHAHRDTQQLLIPVTGSCEVILSDGAETRSYECASPAKGLYIVPMLFIRVCHISPGAVILVLASTHYDKSRSLRSWEEYLEVIGCPSLP